MRYLWLEVLPSHSTTISMSHRLLTHTHTRTRARDTNHIHVHPFASLQSFNSFWIRMPWPGVHRAHWAMLLRYALFISIYHLQNSFVFSNCLVLEWRFFIFNSFFFLLFLTRNGNKFQVQCLRGNTTHKTRMAKFNVSLEYTPPSAVFRSVKFYTFSIVCQHSIFLSRYSLRINM